MNSTFRTILLIAITLSGFLIPVTAYSQLSRGGIPFSIKYQLNEENLPALMLANPGLQPIKTEDDSLDKQGNPYRYAINIPVNINPEQQGMWQDLSNGDRLWRMKVTTKGALALACYFDQFYLPPDARLFLYDDSHRHILGAFTSDNNQTDGRFATELIPGESVVLEYFEPASQRGKAVIELSEISYAYRGVPAYDPSGDIRGFGGSGACEVNVNCPEGQNWQLQKRAVVMIGIKVGGSSYWCSGTLVNNVKQDYSPYVLTADHCGLTATAGDLSQWVFYFNYEGLDCGDPLQEPVHKTLTGASKKAASGGNGQVVFSDLYLVLLKNPVPAAYNPFYSGWNRQNTPSPSGIGIHHPEGDIKKISTYSAPVVSSTWGTTPNTHWAVKWVQTQSGNGVTEGGSSGSPLFNNLGLLVGQLSGGESSCSALNGIDLYGKFSYSWQPSGSDSSNSLHHWLDPDNTNQLELSGLGADIPYVIANFTADNDTVTVGSTVNFSDLTIGSPTIWKWAFDGATPSLSTDQNPKSIQYKKTGVFSVKMRSANNASADSLEKKRYITVLPHIFPNPHSDYVTIDLGDEPSDDFQADVTNLLGQKVQFIIKEITPGTRYGIYISNHVPGMYYLEIKAAGLNLNKKIMLIRTQ
ncbi:MAG: T9SS type A sorting domain-containing protein [Bacteroidetes bacterium]|nr:T9SS type A sorting domain-containing protein [Bacteroidota bacterium]